MKQVLKICLCIGLFWFSGNAFAQIRYNIEYEVRVTSSPNDDAFPESVRQDFGPLFYSESGPIVGDLPDRITTRDIIITSPTEITSYFSSSSGNAGPVSRTYTYSQTSCGLARSWGEAPSISARYFRAVRIRSLAERNPTLASSINSAELCNPVRIEVTGCQSFYSFQYTDDLASGVWRNYLPYQVNQPFFDFDGSLLTGVDLTRTIYVRARYTRGSDYSDQLAFNFLACPPFLENVTPQDATCFDSNDGAVTFDLEENIDTTQDIRFFIVEGALPIVPPSQEDLEETNLEAIFGEASADPIFTTPNSTPSYEVTGLSGGRGTNLNQEYFAVYQVYNQDGTVSTAGITENTFTIRRPSNVSVIATQTAPATCIGENATYTLSASGGDNLDATGTYSYSYRIGNGSFQPTSSTLSIPATSNDQTITVRATYSVNNCSSDDSLASSRFIIPAGSQAIEIDDLPTQSFGTPPTAPGFSNGSIRITLEQGTGPFDYILEVFDSVSGNFTTSATNTNENNTSYTFSLLSEGRYRVVVTPSGQTSCADTSEEFNLVANALPNITNVAPEPPSCIGQLDGRITLEVNGGATPYQFRWYDSTGNQIAGENSLSLENLAPGNYSFRAISSGGDFDTVGAYASVENINVPAAVEIQILNVDPSSPTCFGDTDGSLAITANGATDYDYSLDGGLNWSPLNGNTIDNLDSGIYQVVIRNRAVPICLSALSAEVEITDPDPINVTPAIAPATTIGGFEGSISLTITGGTPFTLPTNPYSITWTKQTETDPLPTPFTDTDISTPYEITGLEAATYRATILDANGCTTNPSPNEIIITEPGELRILDFDKQQDVSCNGENDGVLLATVQGSLPVTYRWIREEDGSIVDTQINSTNAATLTGVEPGEYRLSVQDASIGPLLSANTVVIEEPAAISATINQTPSCSDSDTGTITISNVTGGTLDPNPNYSYSVDDDVNFQLSGNFTDLAEGDHIVRIRENGGCILTQTVNIAPTPAITWNEAASVVTDVSAEGLMDGAITPIFEGGFDDGIVPRFRYVWSGPNVGGITDPSISGLGAGTYSVLVTDDAGCVFPQEFIINEPGALSVTIAAQQNPCFGETNGSITASVAGTGPYTLQWSEAVLGNLPGETGLTLNGAGEGTYTLNVIDLGSTPNAVGNSVAVVLVEPQQITANIDTTPSCAPNDTGTIVISNVQGGEPGTPQDYTYSIDGTTFQNEPLFENQAAATYSVWVRDGNGCDLITSGITIAPSPEIVWDETNTVVTNATVQGANDGTITLAFTSDATNYTYQWNGPGTVNENTQNLTGKAAGVYTVIVTDENMCPLEQIFTIAEPGILTITIGATKNPCFGENNGSIQTNVVGSGNLSFQWSEAILGDLIGETGQNLNNVPQGTYTLTVTDDAINPPNVVSSTPVTLSDPSALLDAQAVPTDAQCAGEANGSVTITASGGIPPYEYSIDAGVNYQAQATFNGLGLGTYSIRVRDSNDCIADDAFTINEPPAITFNSTATPLSAAGSADGAIDIAAGGGTGNLTFSWVGPLGFTPTTDEDISGLIAGEYIVTVQDENGCSFISNPIAIDEPGAIIIMLSINEGILCNGDEFGEIIADVQGGVPDYTYQWFQEGNNTPLDETTNLIGNLGAGNYFLRVTDANGISRDSNILPLTEPNALQVTLQNKVDIVCSGDASGSINIDVQGGTLPYTFQWSTGATSQNLANIEAGDYFVEVFDDNGCSDLLEITIDPAPDALQLDATVTNASEYLANDGGIALTITGGANPYTITWTRDSDNSPAGNTASLTALGADSYTVIVSDANGCNTTETYEVTQPDIVEDTIVQPSCQGDSNGSISVLVNQGNGSFTYLWNTGETTNTISNLGAGEYTVTITGFGDGPLTRNYTLEDPLPLEVDLGPNRVLCVDQVLELDAAVEDDTATYTWASDNGFSSSSPNVTLTTTGNYTVTVQTAAGCTAVGTLFLEVSTDEINAEFAVSSQVFTGEVLVAVDISFPLPDTIEWIVPEGADIVKQDSDEVELIFDQPGEYEITLVTNRGDCIAQKTKKVLVVAKDGSVNEDDDPRKLVEDFIVYPNPTTGRFTADVSLSERGNVSIKVFNFANNALMASERGTGDSSYSIPFDISGMPTGVYAVLLETPYGTSLQKIIVR